MEARTPDYIEGDNTDPENIILRVYYTDGTYVEYATEGRGMYITAVNCPGFMSFHHCDPGPGRPPVNFYYYDYTEGSVTTGTSLFDIM